MSGAQEITQLLQAFGAGEEEALDRLMPLVYEDLRRIARSHLRRGPSGRTLGATGVVHEAYFKLAGQAGTQWENRSHFLAVAARAMRQVIISYARRSSAAKRGGDERPVTLEEGRIGVEAQADSLLDLERALVRLGERNERLVRVVECRYFAGLTEEETADALDISLRTVQRDWARARAWLREELSQDADLPNAGDQGADGDAGG
ncbi:MAG: sigma-70 family RNA polymerase sigma factor [Acidobacteriota bacterium]|nr:sigma-70 family RNA polymerase sigma factor [Acidobacteriota bacterium]